MKQPRLRSFFLTGLLVAGLFAATPFAQAQTSATPAVTILLSDQGTDGGVPYNGLVQASDGNLYGTNQCAGYAECITASGLGPSSLGNIFEITPDGTYSVVYTFTGGNDGSIPQGLVEAPDGNLYGSAVWGGAHGSGTVFQFNLTTQAVTPIYAFTNGTDTANPLGTLIYGDDGYLYGTTTEFENGNGEGALYRVKTNGTGFENLWTFGVSGGGGANTANFGTYPQDGVTKVGTSLFGTSQYGGGGQGFGALWTVNTSSQGVVLHDFTNGTDGGYPLAAPKYNSDGFLYGVTAQCGSSSQTHGTVYTAGLTSGFTTDDSIGTYACYNGRPEFDGRGNFFFTGNFSGSKSAPYGDLYVYNVATKDIGDLYPFPSSGAEGSQPDSQPFLDNQGRVWTEQYGDSNGMNPGAIVAFDLSPAEASPITITPSAQTVATGSPISISWKSTNSFSSNEKVCFATQTPQNQGIGTVWTGVQSGSYSGGVLSGTKTGVIFSNAGDYTLAITCGGQETALATVTATQGAYTTTTTLTAKPNPVPAGDNVTLSATVKKTNGSGTPTGNVTFKTGTTVLATVPLNGSGVAPLTAPTTGYPNGTYPIVASYSGDTNDLASTSSTVNVIIAPKTTTALTASPNPVPHGGTVTLTATVTPAATGNVTFKTGTTTLATAPLSGGVAVLKAPTTGYPAGTYPIVATYAGNATGAGSTSNTVNVVLQ